MSGEMAKSGKLLGFTKSTELLKRRINIRYSMLPPGRDFNFDENLYEIYSTVIIDKKFLYERKTRETRKLNG
ncbi:hypothetical protein K435DRAFT_185321 [Dendrothele bispora CBS 962.96]|uniref:Uncharacterized protein n=1 Tax=Dendrothele bispora (strain CBS 962.96) TaxID=1314807 RepID=A0A4S8KL53_DENBC|nr:hypothetical protein K435DRAFT_185321 [Dendrothele bispora CBS 962.96]